MLCSLWDRALPFEARWSSDRELLDLRCMKLDLCRAFHVYALAFQLDRVAQRSGRRVLTRCPKREHAAPTSPTLPPVLFAPMAKRALLHRASHKGRPGGWLCVPTLWPGPAAQQTWCSGQRAGELASTISGKPRFTVQLGASKHVVVLQFVELTRRGASTALDNNAGALRRAMVAASS